MYSKIILGTAQLGMQYGIGEFSKIKMSEIQCFKILKKAWQLGINTIDTSPNYGFSERRIYKFLKLNPLINFHIITKLKNIPHQKVEKFVKKFVINNIFKKLKNCLSLTVLLHNEFDLTRSRVVNALDDLVASELISNWGVSAYTIGIAKKTLDIKGCKIIQIPFSLFNQSFKKNKLLNNLHLKKKNNSC